MSSLNLDQALQTFIVESRELLEDMETALLSLGENDPDSEAVNAIFRAAHTIKGSAGLFGLDSIVAFTHVLESVLDDVRCGQLTPDMKMIALLLSCGDHIRHLITGVENDQLEGDAESDTRAAALVEQLRVYLGPQAGAPDVDDAHAHGSHGEMPAAPVPISGGIGHWHLSLRFATGVLRNGMDPLSFVRYLRTLGDIRGIVTIGDAIPAVDDMDPECCYLGFEIAFDSTADRATIESVFEFVIDDCELRILAPGSTLDDCAALIREIGSDPDQLAAMWVHCGTLASDDVARVLGRVEHAVEPVVADAPADAADAAAHVEHATPAGVSDRATAAGAPNATASDRDTSAAAKTQRAKDGPSLRVDAQRLDQLIDLIGELTIAAAGASIAARRHRISELEESTSTLTALVEEVRDTALQLRMVRIGATFNRFQRVVHDLSLEIGKDIALTVSGEETELDKTLVEKLTDPLTHMVRNAIDHGIEAPEVRLAAGKPARGTVALNAYHDSGSIVIEVSDDGAGLKRDRILAKAIERGLVDAEQRLTDSEIYDLIFEPGFSTAEQVTNLSGRGVGMDVVKRNITALRGSIGIDSVLGRGTRIVVRLPLTLAIIDGFMVSIDGSVFTIPLEMVEECIEFDVESMHDYTNLRGQVLPFIRMRELFGVETDAPRRQSVVVIRHAGSRAGLVVDSLLGEFQTVIKPLSPIFSHVRCVSGSTILGSGEVALILDVPALFETVHVERDRDARSPNRADRVQARAASVHS
ncbi:chemotaxis protein CheA [Pararobbsia silviterrae]|uniref:Chemotaxis protein CheA n=1 Tax=Pararobbsia silviterrae TaxID=1792498 RepID=A0A494Y9L2_9BURK|nr:chemotaxis protein CheA [Pararobbsia silviterrae]RKP56590.1 chemotaxis protein CheA [Pararobbsia silviterrae]